MNSNAILSDDMSLEEKLAAIDKAMNDKDVREKFNRDNGRPLDAPVDPADLTMCEGCQ